MTKVDTNDRTYGPAFRGLLLERRFMVPIASLRLEKQTGDFDTQITHWLETWNPFFSDVPLSALYVDGCIEKVMKESELAALSLAAVLRDLKLRKPDRERKVDSESGFEENPTKRKIVFTRIDRKPIPYELREQLLTWAAETLTSVKPTLRVLFERYEIPPAYVLDELGQTKAHFIVFEEALNVAAHIRSAEKRQKDANTLFKAAKILRKWEPIHPVATEIKNYPNSDDVTSIAKTLLSFGPAQNYRPTEVEIRHCATKLSSVFVAHANKPLYGYIGELLKSAFPKKWNPASDVREATKKLLKVRKAPQKDR